MDRPTIRVLGFRTTYHKRPDSVELVARDWVRYAPLHDINTVTEEMVHLLRPKDDWADDEDRGLKMGYMASIWTQIEPAYRAWKTGTEVPASGIPLSAWAGVTADQADVLRRSGVRTVEEIAGLTEGQIGKIMLPGVRSMKRMAAEFLESRKDSETASKVTALEEQNAALKAQLDHMAGMIATMQGTPADEADAIPPAKRGPGRPRKTETVEEAA